MKTDRGRKRIPFGLPKDIVLLPTPSGWRHSISTVDGGLVCGRLRELPADADAEQAMSVAAAMLMQLGREFHATALDVTWEPTQQSGSWCGRIRPSPDAPAEGT
ncbi:hypothetical protein GCM10020000_79230 [Streptomyces olivoverticillatus]